MSTTDRQQMSVRFPADVFAALKDAAWAVRVSRNTFVVEAVRAAIEAARDAEQNGDAP